ncbi:MAG TPA: hypothetical protein VMX57_02250, partial [Planctomycetota bacterium]|nr:hypothetical protein [Planctomycetota bacterium]
MSGRSVQCVTCRVCLSVVLATAARGCRSMPTPEPPAVSRPVGVTPVFAGRWETLGTSVEGRPIRAWTA